MDLVFISIIAVTLAGFLTNRYIRRRKIKEQYQLVPDVSINKSCLMLTISPCRSIIDKALECLSSHDVIGVCKNHRLGSEKLEILGREVKEYSRERDGLDIRPTIYHEYMLEATEKIAETARNIITTPDKNIPVSYKCEIDVIRESLARLLQSTDNILHTDDNPEIIGEENSKEKDFIRHSIDIHSKRMVRHDFDDESQAYSYLMLLYYLHSFVSSFSQVVKNIKIDYHPLTA